MERYPSAKENMHITGHSLGGLIAKEFCKENQNTTCVTFESPNLHTFNGGKTYTNITEFRNKGDLITFGQSEANEVNRITPSASGHNYLSVLGFTVKITSTCNKSSV